MKQVCVVLIIGIATVGFAESGARSETVPIVINGIAFNLPRSISPSGYRNTVTGVVTGTVTIPASMLQITFPQVLFGGRHREEIFVVLRDAHIARPIDDGYEALISGQPEKMFEGYAIYEIDPVHKLFVSTSPAAHPNKVRCDISGSFYHEETLQTCEVSEYLYPPTVSGSRDYSVVVGYTLTNPLIWVDVPLGPI